MINDDIAARIAAKAARDTEPTLDALPTSAIAGLWSDPELQPMTTEEWVTENRGTLPWLQPATVDPDWLTEARNHSAATREPFTHPLWDVSAA